MDDNAFTNKGDAGAILPWILNALHMALGGTKKSNSSIIYKNFLGKMRIHTQKLLPAEADDKKKRELEATGKHDKTSPKTYRCGMGCWKEMDCCRNAFIENQSNPLDFGIELKF